MTGASRAAGTSRSKPDDANGDGAPVREGDQADGDREGPLSGEGGPERQQCTQHGSVTEQTSVGAHEPMLTHSGLRADAKGA